MNTSKTFDKLPFAKQKMIMRKKGFDYKHFCNAVNLNGFDCGNKSFQLWGYCKRHSIKDKNGCNRR